MRRPTGRELVVSAALGALALLLLVLFWSQPGRNQPTAAPTSGGGDADASRAADAPRRGAADSPATGSRGPLGGSASAAPSVEEFQARRESAGEEVVWIEGRVTERSGSPIAAARLNLLEPLSPGAQILASTASDSEGRFQFAAQPSGRLRLTVEKEGFAGLEDFLELPGPGVFRRDYVLPAATASIEGVVTDGNEMPLVGVRVGVFFSENYSAAKNHRFLPSETRSDSRGRFAFRGLPAADVQLSFLLRGYLIDGTSIALDEGEEAVVRFHMTRGRGLELLVTDPEGTPLKDAQMTCGGPAPSSSDSEGWIYLVLPPGEAEPVNCSISAPGHLAEDILIDPNVKRGRVTLKPGPEFRGLVLNSEGRPIGGAKVIVSGRGRHFEGEVATDSGGRFSILLSRPPVSVVSASSSGYLEARLRFDEGAAPNDLELRLKRPEAGLFGVVVDFRGAPVRLFTVRLSDGESTYSRHFNDPGGRFEIRDLPAGTFQVRCTSPEPELSGLVAGSDPIELPAGRTVGELILRFPPP